MVSDETLLSYPYCMTPFTVNIDTSDKHLVGVLSHNDEPITFLSRRLSKPQSNYTTNKKELLAIMEYLKQFQGIIFGYEINIFSYHKNLFYTATLSESQKLMLWQIIPEEFGPNIHHMDRVDNTVAYDLSRFLSTKVDKYKTSTSKDQCRKN